MTTLVVGATGATGRLLVEHLLCRGQDVRVVVRSPDKLPGAIRNNSKVSMVQASIHEASDEAMCRYVDGCDAVASCLGHTLSFKGIYGRPHTLVSDVTRRLCGAIRYTRAEKPVKFVLMNTSGCRNPELDERRSMGEACIIGLLRLLLPPHVDNEKAAEHLRTRVGHDSEAIEWSVVRPDNLVNENEMSDYEVHASPSRGVIFDAGQTSRINVGHFMAELITDDSLWCEWKGRMPVIYNAMPA